MKPTSGPATGKRVLIYYIQFTASPGGSEYLPLLFMEECQKRGCSITLALNWESDVGRTAALYGVDLDLRKIDVIVIKPKKRFLDRLDNILPFYRVWQLKKLAKHSDVCISAANMFDFGQPAHHVVILLRLFGDNLFHDFFIHKPPLTGFPRFKQAFRTFVAETFLRPLLGIRSTRKILADQREHIYVPSRYVADTMLKFYGPFNCTVFYPPTMFEPVLKDVRRDPLRVVYLGRIAQEKHVETIIGIVERTREMSGLDLSLHIAGSLDSSPYVDEIRRMAEKKPWIHLVGAVFDKDKERFLLSGTYAVHATREEAFGISITEYLKAGIIPIVPDEGGSTEVADNPEITYHSDQEAAGIMTRLLSDEAFRKKQLAFCEQRAKVFSKESYMSNQRKLLDRILSDAQIPRNEEADR